nr:hypothetical protein [Tanacetum cinerariifolium]
EDVNLKFLQSLPSEWKTHTLIWRNKAGSTTQNLAFVSSSNTDSTTELVSVAASVFTVCAKMPMSSLPNVDSLSNAVIYSFFVSQSSSPQLDNEDLKHIDVDDLEEIDLKWQMAMKGNFAREYRSPKDSKRNGAVEPQRRNGMSLSIMLLWLFHLRALLLIMSDGYHAVPPPYTGTFMPSKPDLVFNTAPTVETAHLAFNVQLSPTKPKLDLSHINRPTAPIIEDWLSDSEDESKTKAPQIVPSFVQSTEQVKSPRHSVQHVETSIPADTLKPTSPKPTSNGKRRNRKACFVCKSLDHLIKDYNHHEKKMAKPTARNHAHRGNHKHHALMTHHNPQKHMVPTTVLTQSKPISITAVRPVSTAVPKTSVTRPKQINPIVTKPKSPIRRYLTHIQSPQTSNSPPRVTVV